MFMVIIGKIFKDVGFVLCIVEGDGLKYFRDCVIGRVFKEIWVFIVVWFVDLVLFIRDLRIFLGSFWKVRVSYLNCNVII